MELLDPPPLPAPPPAPASAPGRSATGIALAAALALVVAIAVGAAGGGSDSAESGSPSTSATPSPSASPSTSGFGFLYTRSNGEPYLWPTCGSIHFMVNLRGAPNHALADAKEAVGRITEASGMPWVFDGLTRESPSHRFDVFDEGPSEGSAWPPVLVAWLPHREFVGALDLGGDRSPEHILGFGMPKHGSSASDSDHFVSGLVVLDAGQPIPRGFGTRFSRGVVLMHELAHIMGLAHVDELDELMYAGKKVPPRQKDWGEGDLAGLAEAGRDPSCD